MDDQIAALRRQIIDLANQHFPNGKPWRTKLEDRRVWENFHVQLVNRLGQSNLTGTSDRKVGAYRELLAWLQKEVADSGNSR